MRRATLSRRLGALAAILLAASAAAATPAQFARGRGGAVAAEEENAARAGIEILKKGGNATDAAVAMAFALAVTWPEAGNLGGGGFWLSRDVRGRVQTIDFRERAPRAARRDMFLPASGAPAESAPSSTDSPLASGVPGTVDGLALAHRRGGRLPWKRVLEPAQRLARDGFVMTENVDASIAAHKSKLAADPAAASIFLPGGEAPLVGSVFRQPALAATLDAIAERGEDGFYRGRVAREIEEGQKRTGGLITRGDLALYASRIRRPVQFQLGDAEVFTTGAPSSGPVLAQMALLVGAVGASRVEPRDAGSAHLVAEIEKRAFSDRNRYLGDPDFSGVKQGLFLSAPRARRLAATIDTARATLRETVGALSAGSRSSE